jgi:serine/threonine-protein kinase
MLMSISHAPSGSSSVPRLGRYGLLAQIGQGGMGKIHLAVAPGLGEFRKLLVVKELRPDWAANTKFVEMFLAEAKLAARLNHPNIVQTLEAGQDGERYFLAMEFLDGQPLTEVLKRADHEPPITPAMRVQLLCEVLAGLHYAHELRDYADTPLQIVHRDVSPQNVFVTYHGQVKLVDFGIAKAIDIEGGTAAGVFKGKFAYAAPEQVRGQGVDRRVDVFAVGVMLWEMLAKKRFAPGGPSEAAIDARLAGAEPRLSSVAPDVDPELAAICDRAMHVDVEQRYASAEEFRLALEQYLVGRGELARGSEIGLAMRQRFTTERKRMHQLINAQVVKQIAGDEGANSIIRSLTRSDTAPGSTTPGRGVARERGSSSFDEEPTPVGDLSRWIESSRADNPIPLVTRSARHKSRRRRKLGLSVLALAAFCATYAWVRTRTESSQASAPQARAAPPPLAATPAPREAAPPVVMASEAAPAPPSSEPQHLVKRARRRVHGDEDTVVDAPTPNPPPSPIARPRAPAPSIASAPAPSIASAPAPSIASAPAPVAASPLPKSSSTVQLGDDLRPRRGPRAREPRPIETDDPFR